MKPLIAFDFVPPQRDEVKCNQRTCHDKCVMTRFKRVHDHAHMKLVMVIGQLLHCPVAYREGCWKHQTKLIVELSTRRVYPNAQFRSHTSRF
eukprot:gene21537-biopygen1817